MRAIILCAALTAVNAAFAFIVVPVKAETLVAPETNPPGDIPDSQVFVAYVAPAGYSLAVPEGWTRTEQGDGVRFADKYGIVAVALRPSGAGDTDPAAAMSDVPGAQVVKSGTAKLSSGPALKVRYLANSAPNAVTGRIILLEHDRYVIPGPTRTAILDLAAPAGADNVDQWRLISNSFRWQ